jgi:hypothetical protein
MESNIKMEGIINFLKVVNIKITTKGNEITDDTLRAKYFQFYCAIISGNNISEYLDLDINILFGEYTLLIIAYAHYKKDIFDILLKNANINMQDKFGSTVLHCAVERGDIDRIKQILLIKGVNVDIKDNNVLTPLNIAEKNKNIDIINLINKYK